MELPDDGNRLGVNEVKHTSRGIVKRFKAILVVKGHVRYGIDYDNSFSSVVRFSSIKALLAFAVHEDVVFFRSLMLYRLVTPFEETTGFQ